MEVHGDVEMGFEGVRDAFAQNFERHGDVGAAVAIRHRGRSVVDLWAGVADEPSARPWARDTVQLIFSASKGVTAILVHRLAEQGRLDLDARVAEYWSEFAANGKERITIRDVLAHRAGLAAVDGDLSFEEVLAWEPVVRAIAAQAPAWEPGSAHGYHARSYGWILGEVVRRVTGVSLGTHLATEVSEPLGLDLWIGVPRDVERRLATIIPPAPGPSIVELLGAGSLTARVMTGPSELFEYNHMWNRLDLLAAEMPSSNGVASARALARLYAATVGEVDGIRLLRPETVTAARAVQSDGPDRVLLIPTRFGSGFMVPPMLGPSCPPTAFGHPGAGGCLAFADPARELAFGYVTTRMKFEIGEDARQTSLVRAAYAALDA